MEAIDLSGMTVLPGFIDIHIHGGLGVRSCQSLDAVKKINEYLPSTGTTSWLSTVATIEGMEYVVSAIEEEPEKAQILGIHMEGPFLAPKHIPGTPHEEPHLPNLSDTRRTFFYYENYNR